MTGKPPPRPGSSAGANPPERLPWGGAIGVAARASVDRLAVILLAGAVSGVLVGGIGGRLAMLVLARANSGVSGQLTDDGFVMGRFTLVGTLNLMVATLFLGVVGALVYACVRPLVIGPRWFQIASVAAGAGVVVAALIVHRDGVDFVALQPVWLAIAMFVALPALYAVVLRALAERWLAPGSWLTRVPRFVALGPLVFLLFVLPILPVLVFVWLVAQALRMWPAGAAALDSAAASWLGRGVLGVVFVVGLQDLVADAAALV